MYLVQLYRGVFTEALYRHKQEWEKIGFRSFRSYSRISPGDRNPQDGIPKPSSGLGFGGFEVLGFRVLGLF